ncbi:MAG: peptidylprolyl isomerase [Planctomycetota bacterium]
MPTDPAAIVAVVGQTPILLADLLPKIDARIRMAIAKSGGQQPPEDQLKIARTNMARGLLVQAIQNKMMRESFLLQQVGTQTSQQRAEADAKLTQRARQMFRENELPELMKQYECSDLAELDDKLSAKGSSLLLRQSDFIDMMLGHLYISGNVDKEPEVSMAEIVGYYREHQEEYMKPDRARWEQLSAHFDKAGSREEAWKWINTMALEALYGGNLQAVARKMSHGSYANQGGVHDWTAKGSLVSEPINATIFLIPENKMSEIIEDQRGFHVVRVLGRKAAGYTPLAEVQDEIRNTIQKQKIAKSQEKTLRRMHKMIPVWSMFPGDIPGAMPLPGTAAPTPVQNSAPVQNRASVQNRDTGNTRPRYTARANP